ncbi:hypothetical protein [Peristeroidobacter agariperforans]|uniref:hypothetical protein n=1 Tax=Peristeroidobacter agariperforans TaxID=268404 RepID=UPI00101D54B1|nr:hypothetical protein [Peristeroidobacter agariperforans]
MINALDNPVWRELLLGQLDERVKAFDRNTAMFKAFQESEKAGKINSSLRPSGSDCLRLIEIGMRGQFPSRDPWRPVGTEILSWFWTLVHPCFPEVVQTHFAAASDPSRAYGLTLLATQSTPEAAASIVKLLGEYPLPDGLPPRFFWEMNKRHAATGSQLFPKMLVDAGPHLANVMNFLNVCLEGSALTSEALAPVSGWVASESLRLLDAVEPLQQSVGKQWRCDEQYSSMRSQLGVFLDLLGIIPGAPMAPCARAVELKDPLCAFFAIVSTLKKNLPPPDEAILLVADSFQTRVPLYDQLSRLHRLDLFPAHLLTFESFAAASMAEWLLYPTELGYEPTRLDLMAKVSGVDEDKEFVMCLWKVSAEGHSDFAAASGPYDANAPIGPLSGDNTFSNFTEWGSRTPDEHLAEIVETLDQWRVEWCER